MVSQGPTETKWGFRFFIVTELGECRVRAVGSMQLKGPCCELGSRGQNEP
jgi:hypothetical protein